MFRTLLNTLTWNVAAMLNWEQHFAPIYREKQSVAFAKSHVLLSSPLVTVTSLSLKLCHVITATYFQQNRWTILKYETWMLNGATVQKHLPNRWTTLKYECGMAPLSKNIFQIHIWHIALFKSSASHSCLTEKYRMGAPLWKIASFNTFSQRIINLSFFGSINEFWVCWSYLVVTQKNIVMHTSTQVEVPK